MAIAKPMYVFRYLTSTFGSLMYSEDALMEGRLLSERNLTLIQKPFDPEDLARRIRESLDRNGSTS